MNDCFWLEVSLFWEGLSSELPPSDEPWVILKKERFCSGVFDLGDLDESTCFSLNCVFERDLCLLKTFFFFGGESDLGLDLMAGEKSGWELLNFLGSKLSDGRAGRVLNLWWVKDISVEFFCILGVNGGEELCFVNFKTFGDCWERIKEGRLVKDEEELFPELFERSFWEKSNESSLSIESDWFLDNCFGISFCDEWEGIMCTWDEEVLMESEVEGYSKVTWLKEDGMFNGFLMCSLSLDSELFFSFFKGCSLQAGNWPLRLKREELDFEEEFEEDFEMVADLELK